MTQKELKKLNRRELLQMLLTQSRKLDEQTAEIADLKKKLEEKRAVEKNAGSIAEAALGLYGVFEAAQKAADYYLDAVRLTAEREEQRGES